MSKKVQKSEKRIDDVLNLMCKKGVTPSGKGWNEDTTLTTYKDMLKALVREYHETYGVADIQKFDEQKLKELLYKRVDGYFEGNLSQAHNIRTALAAVRAYNHGIEEIPSLKSKHKPLKMDTREMRHELNNMGVIRRGRASSILRATPEQARSVLDNMEATLNEYRDKGYHYDTTMREISYHSGRIANETGGRIASIMKLKVDDVVVDKTKNEIRFRKDKGGLSRAVRIPPETAAYLAELTEGKKSNQHLFTSKRRNGSFKSRQAMTKEVEKIIKQAGNHLNETSQITMKNRDGEKVTMTVHHHFTPHSFRKSFSVRRTMEYHEQFSTKSQIDKHISERIKENEKVKEKLTVARQRINHHMYDKTGALKTNPKTGSVYVPRDLSREEYAIFCTSLDLGHFRNDVITSWYTTFNEIKSYVKDK
ncbi:integrase [Priestia megaterium]|uniref:site-specific integrase n=1 Tax=Priestia megaterium TaxID=1404 RepID=UPI0033930908